MFLSVVLPKAPYCLSLVFTSAGGSGVARVQALRRLTSSIVACTGGPLVRYPWLPRKDTGTAPAHRGYARLQVTSTEASEGISQTRVEPTLGSTKRKYLLQILNERKGLNQDGNGRIGYPRCTTDWGPTTPKQQPLT